MTAHRAETTMAFRQIGDLIFLVHGLTEPSPLEWAAYMNHLHVATQGGTRELRYLVYTLGAGPNLLQRTELNELIEEAPGPVSVVSDRPAVKLIVTALAWFNPRVRLFETKDYASAVTYLQIPPHRFKFIKMVVDEMVAEVGGSHEAPASPHALELLRGD